MRADERAGLLAYRFDSIPPEFVDALVSTRRGGVSTGRHESLNLGLRVDDADDLVGENRRRFFDAYGVSLERSVWCRQIHRDSVAVVGNDDLGRGAFTEEDIVADTDALVTDIEHAALCVTLADCVPVVIYDPEHHVLGLAHAGWGGTVRRICSRTVETMVGSWGTDPARIAAAIGPSISPEHYEVGQDVVDQATDAYGADSAQVVRTLSDGRRSFDLWAANTLDLVSAGVPRSQIEVAGISTATALDRFYSHRIEGPTGRFIAAAVLRPRSARTAD